MAGQPDMRHRGYARVAITGGGLALLLLVALVLDLGRLTRPLFPEATAIQIGKTPFFSGSFKIRARARGLFPGASRPLRLRIRNPNRFAIKVNKVKVRIRRDLTRPRCYPRRYLHSTRLRVPVRVPARSIRRTRTRLKIRMRTSAPDACQNAIFPLRLRGRAVRP